MAILTSIKDVFNAKQYKFEIERLTEENERLKYIKLTPTQMALSQILAKTKELEVELDGYDNLIDIKTKAIKELIIEYSNQSMYQTREFEQKSSEYDKLIEEKSNDLESKTLEYEDLIKNKSKEYDDLVSIKETELFGKSKEYETLIETKTKAIEDLNSRYNDTDAHVENLKSQIIILDDEILMQSYGVYKHKDNPMNSEICSTKLQEIREKQMDMIKSKEAIEFKQWIVNGNVSADNKIDDDITEGMIKLVLRIFNDECDSIIDKVKFSNIEVIENLIKKFFEDLNNLGNTTQVKIVTKYFNTKIDELYLAYEYKLKKQQEAEA